MRTEIAGLLAACFSDDEKLAMEAIAVTQALVEKNIGLASDGSDEHFKAELKENVLLEDELGFSDFYNLKLEQGDLDHLISAATQAMFRLDSNSLRAVKVLRYAAELDEVKRCSEFLIANHWRENERLSEEILSLLWDKEVLLRLRNTLLEISSTAKAKALRDAAKDLLELDFGTF